MFGTTGLIELGLAAGATLQNHQQEDKNH
ncbi:hypothetical protein [Synechocystis sp. PCC 7339]